MDEIPGRDALRRARGVSLRMLSPLVLLVQKKRGRGFHWSTPSPSADTRAAECGTGERLLRGLRPEEW